MKMKNGKYHSIDLAIKVNVILSVYGETSLKVRFKPLLEDF